MPAKIIYEMAIKGLPETIIQLKEMDGLLSSIARKSGLVGGSGSNNRNGSNNNNNTTVNLPSNGNGSSGAAKNGLVEAAVAGAIAGRTSQINSIKPHQGQGLGFGRYDEILKGLGFEPVHFGNPAPNPKNKEEPKPYEGPIPPKIQGIGSQIVSQFYKEIKGKFSPNGLGKGAIEGSGGISGLAGGLVNKLGALGAVAVVLTGTFLALKLAVHLMEIGIKHSTEAYQNAAKAGTGIDKNFALINALKSIGVEPDTKMLQGRFNSKTGKFDPYNTQQILQQARGGAFGDSNQLLNMSKEFEAAVKDAAANSQQMQEASKASMQLSIQSAALTREIKTAFSQWVAELYPVISTILSVLKLIISLINSQLQLEISFLQLLRLVPRGPTDFKNVQSGGSSTPFTSFEKMGFVMNNSFSPEKQLQDINKNTRDTVEAISKLGEILGKSASSGGALLGLPNLP